MIVGRSDGWYLRLDINHDGWKAFTLLPSQTNIPAASRPVPPEVTATNNKKLSQFAAKTPTDKLLCISQGRDHGPGGLRHIAGLLILNILFLSAAATWMLLYNLSCARPSQWRWWWWLLIRADGCSGGVTRADVGIHHVPVLQRCILYSRAVNEPPPSFTSHV